MDLLRRMTNSPSQAASKYHYTVDCAISIPRPDYRIKTSSSQARGQCYWNGPAPGLDGSVRDFGPHVILTFLPSGFARTP